ncbi:MAG: hypothetical protein ABEI06_09565 [Halobacteriaceae archaeon]
MIRRLLWAVGYIIAPVLFLGANTPEDVVRRLRFAYRLVGVSIEETGEIHATQRTIFLCPYRNIGSRWVGEKEVCHDILDRVDDGYVSYLARHKNIDYQRPQSCDNLQYCEKSEYCFSEVSDL